MEEQIQEFAALAQKRADKRNRSIEDVIHNMTHESYLMKHTTKDVLKELIKLQELYPDAFYNGEANDHLMTYLENPSHFEFWYDYVYLALAAGLEWAILEQVRESVPNAGSSL